MAARKTAAKKRAARKTTTPKVQVVKEIYVDLPSKAIGVGLKLGPYRATVRKSDEIRVTYYNGPEAIQISDPHDAYNDVSFVISKEDLRKALDLLEAA